MNQTSFSKKTITLAHGNGGRLSHELLRSVLLPAFGSTSSQQANHLSDSALIKLPSTANSKLVFTTDSHVVSPLFFPGGDIGKLSVNGTLNDLAVMGARPLFLSCSMIIEEGFSIEELRKIVHSMADAAKLAEVKIVTGDTKVVEKGAADKIFINTSGIGVLLDETQGVQGVESAKPGDFVIVSGTLGDHGAAIYVGREGIQMQTALQSDCACVFPLVQLSLQAAQRSQGRIRIMRDPTRGGLATTLNEFVEYQKFGIHLQESKLPIRDEVQGICELLGFDPLYIANEGKLVLIVSCEAAEAVLSAIKAHPLGERACVIGELTERAPGRVYLTTAIGGERVLDMLTGEMLPRIC